MNTNHDALREALEPCPFCGESSDLTVHVYGNGEDDAYVQCRECTTCGPDGGDRAGAIAKWNHRALSQPMPEAAAQKTPLDKLRHEMRLVTALTLKNPGVAITLPDLMATEGRKFMRGEPSLFDQLPFGEMQSVTAMLSAPPAAPAQPQAQSATLRQCTNPDSAGPEGAKPCSYPDCKCPTETPCLQGRAQPQAQGEPEAWALKFPGDNRLNLSTVFDTEIEAREYRGTCVTAGIEIVPLITVQSHREAFEAVRLANVEAKQMWDMLYADYKAQKEALAQHRSALKECVEALKLAMHWAGPAMERDMRSPSNSQWMVEKTQAQEDSIYAAITHANQVLGRKEGVV